MTPTRRIVRMAAAGALMAIATLAQSLENPGFESGDLSGWETFGLGWRIGAGEDAASGSHGAVCDVLHEHEGETWRGITQTVSVVPGRTYSASVDIRTVNIRASSSFLELQWLDAAEGVIAQLQSPWVTIDQPFTPAALSAVTAPPGAVAASVRGIVFAERLPEPDQPEFHIFDQFRFWRQ